MARNFGAKAPLDTAVRDLVARRAGADAAGVPRVAGAGAAARTGDAAYPAALRTDVTLSAGSADDLAAAAVQRVADGFSTLKMKVGTDAATDVARVRAVREAVGPAVTIRLDANQGWTPDEAVTVIRALERADLGVELVEQPVPGEDVEGLAAVRAGSGCRSWPTRRSTAWSTSTGSSGWRPPTSSTSSWPSAARSAWPWSSCAGRPRPGLGTMVGSMMETAIGVGAVAAVAAAHPTSVVDDLDAAWWAAVVTRRRGSRVRR